MGKTANIGLHQWTGTDQFLREEFNEDFQKIDGAVGDMPFVRLVGTEVTGEMSQVDFDLSGIELGRFSMLLLVCRTVGSGVVLRINGDDSLQYEYHSWWNSDTANSGAVDGMRLTYAGAEATGGSFSRCTICPGMGSIFFTVATMYNAIAQQMIGRYSGCGLEAVRTLSVIQDRMSTGEHFYLYGVRK